MKIAEKRNVPVSIAANPGEKSGRNDRSQEMLHQTRVKARMLLAFRPSGVAKGKVLRLRGGSRPAGVTPVPGR